MSIVIGGTFSYLKLSIGIPVLVILFCLSCLSLWKAHSRQSIAIPSLLVVLCGIAISVGQFYFSESKKLNFATPDELTASILQNKNIRIGDLTREESVIRGKTFENCHIYGPAIIGLQDCILSSVNKFTEIDVNGVFIETTNKTVSGAIGFDACVIKNCVFHKISFIGSPKSIRGLKEKFFSGN